ncbi:MAG: FHA domain-containing protein [Deltaproteobacteria bacterium]|nr:FHA domain-containing protein [Deltaproteobacteria bacterium]
MAFIEILNGPQAGEKVVIAHETFFLGRDANNHLVLTERTVSRKHAVINKVDGDFTINDLKSLKGLLINGEKKEEATLQDGDEIALGGVRLRFYAQDTVPETVSEPVKNRKGLYYFLFFVLFCLLAGGVYLFFSWKKESPKSVQNQQKSLTSALDEFTAKEENIDQLISAHYLKGVELFNAKRDIEGAKKEWEEVLRLDPQRKTLFAQKAAKLLEKLGK